MNSGDARGDMFFSLQSTYSGMLCGLLGGNNVSSELAADSLACSNGETTSSAGQGQLVYTKLELEHREDADFAGYQLCNICVDGKDPAPAAVQALWLAEHAHHDAHDGAGAKPLQCAYMIGETPVGDGVQNCSAGVRHCWKFGSAAANVSGCDTANTCETLHVQPGQCVSLPGGLRVRCSPAGADFDTPLSPATDFQDPCPAAVPKPSEPKDARNCSMLPIPEYICDGSPGGHSNSSRVGAENISAVFGNPRVVAGMLKAYSPGSGWRKTMVAAGVVDPAQQDLVRATVLWGASLAAKLGGTWYSTPASSMCNSDAGASSDEPGAPSCSWSVASVTKRVDKACADASIYEYIEGKNSTCFAACQPVSGGGGRGGGGGHGDGSGNGRWTRNTTDPCWVRCIFDTILGPDASSGSLPNQSSETTGGGLSLAQLDEAWDRPMASEDPSLGGCPALPAAGAHSVPVPASAGGSGGNGGGGGGGETSKLIELIAAVGVAGLVLAVLMLCCAKQRKRKKQLKQDPASGADGESLDKGLLGSRGEAIRIIDTTGYM